MTGMICLTDHVSLTFEEKMERKKLSFDRDRGMRENLPFNGIPYIGKLIDSSYGNF